jgi:uncharacterized OB-fold protein
VTGVDPLPQTGVLYSWTTVYRTFGYNINVPYTVGCIELTGGGRILARIDSPRSGPLVVGAIMRWRRHPDDIPHQPRFEHVVPGENASHSDS